MFASNTSAGSSSQRCWFLTLWGLLIRSRKCAGRASVHVADVDIKNASKCVSTEDKCCTSRSPICWVQMMHITFAYLGYDCANWSPKRRPNFAEDSTLIARIQKKVPELKIQELILAVHNFWKKWSSIFCGNACNIGWILLWFHRSAAREPTCFQK